MLLAGGFFQSQFFSRQELDPDRFGSLAAERNLHTVHGINGRVANRRAVHDLDSGIWNKAHVHQVILYAGWEVQRYQNSALAYFEIAKYSQPHSRISPQSLRRRRGELRPDQSYFSIRLIQSGLQKKTFN